MGPQSAPTEIETPRLGRPIGRGPKTAPASTGSAAYASGTDLASLAEFLNALNSATEQSGWRADTMIVSLGKEAETIVVGVRWMTNAYYVEIR